MNSKRVNWLFFFIILIDMGVLFGMMLAGQSLSIGVLASLFLSQAIIFVPAILSLVFTRTKPTDLIAIKRPKWSISLLVILITYLCMPLITTINAFSMLFVENEVTNLQALLQGIPVGLVLLMIALIGPVSEEFVFRGVIYHGYRSSGRIIPAMILSAFLFGVMHLNFNQMSYAIVVGVIGVLLIEGTGNLFYSILFHVCINFSNGLLLVWQDPETAAMDAGQSEQMIESAMNMPYKEALCVVVSVYAVIACVTTAIAGCIYYFILKREGRVEHVRLLFSKEGKSGVSEENRKMITWPLIVSVSFCLAYMVVEIALLK